MLVEVKKPENKRIVNFVKNHYLYLDQVEDLIVSTSFMRRKNFLFLYNFLESIRINDIFTYILFGEYYDMLKEEEMNNSIEYEIL